MAEGAQGGFALGRVEDGIGSDRIDDEWHDLARVGLHVRATEGVGIPRTSRVVERDGWVRVWRVHANMTKVDVMSQTGNVCNTIKPAEV